MIEGKLLRKNPLLLLTVCSLLAGCGGQSLWSEFPPHLDDATQMFHEHRETYEELAARILSSEYVAARGGCVFDRDDPETPIYGKVTFTEEIIDSTSGETMYQYKRIEDMEWAQLLCTPPYYRVDKDDGYASFVLGSSVTGGNRITFISMHNNPLTYEKLSACQPEYKRLDCGFCFSDLDDGWHFRYLWSPEDLMDDKLGEIANGTLSNDEYSRIQQERLNACRRSGYSAIGYNPEDFGL